MATGTLPLSRREVPERLSDDGAEIPRNLVRFRVLDDKHTSAVSLHTAEGVRVATHVKDGVLTPDTNPAPGEWVLTYPVQRRDGKVTSDTYRFRVLAAAPLELRPPVLERQEHGFLYPDSPRNQAAFARLRYYPPDANGNAAHLLEYTVTVDGRAYQFDPSTSQRSGLPIIELKSLCQPYEGVTPGWEQDTCGKLHAVPQGKHTLTVMPHVLGETVQPSPVPFEVTLDCSQAASIASVATPISPLTAAADASAKQAIAPTRSTPPIPHSAVADSLTLPDAQPTATGPGCTLNPVGPNTFWPTLLLGSCLVWRRRAAATCPSARGAGTSSR